MLTQKTRGWILRTRHVKRQQAPPLDMRVEYMPREQLADTLDELRTAFPTVHTGVMFFVTHGFSSLDDAEGERGACLVVLLHVVVEQGLQLVE